MAERPRDLTAARIAYRAGDFERSVDLYRSAAAKLAAESPWMVEAIAGRAWAMLQVGRTRPAEEVFREALRAARRADHRAVLLRGIAEARAVAGELDASERTLREALRSTADARQDEVRVVLLDDLGRLRERSRGGTERGAYRARARRLARQAGAQGLELRLARDAAPGAQPFEVQVPVPDAVAARVPASVQADVRPPAPARRQRSGRYVNVHVLDAEGEHRVSTLAPGGSCTVLVDVGDRRSAVPGHQPLPDERLPPDAAIEVTCSSGDLLVEAGPGISEERSSPPVGVFVLPEDRERPASTPAGERSIGFRVTVPDRPRPSDDAGEVSELGRMGRARIGLWFRDALLQSFVLHVDAAGEVEVWQDFQVSESLADLGPIRNVRRLGIVLNDDGSVHDLTVRDPHEPRPAASSVTLPAEVEQIVGELREVLHARAPTRRRRTRSELVADLRGLAPLGHRLYLQFKSGHETALARARAHPETVISISRPTTTTFTVPWTLVYDIPLSADVAKPEICPSLDVLDGSGPLCDPGVRSCPHAGAEDHLKDVLCPFGFWGFRYNMEVLSRRDQIEPSVRIPGAPNVAACVTQQLGQRQVEALEAHLQRLRTRVQSRLGAPDLVVADDLETTWEQLGAAQSFVYFYCHGQRPRGVPSTYLTVGEGEALAVDAILQQIDLWQDASGTKRPWEETSPLVVLNACHSVQIDPTWPISYVDAFVASCRAAGVIGTEARVEPSLGIEFADSLFSRFFGAPGAHLGTALREARIDLLRDGNLLGLAYTPYCWDDLRYERAVP